MENPFKKLKATKSSGGEGYEIPRADTHPARLVALIDLGTQYSEYNGEGSTARKVFFVWELTAEKKSGMKDVNHVIGDEYTLSLHETSNLRKMLEQWTGNKIKDDEGFPFEELLGKDCLVQVIHKEAKNSGNTYAKVIGVARAPSFVQVPAAQHKPFTWFVGSADPYPAYDWVPYRFGEPVERVISRCEEYRNSKPADQDKPLDPSVADDLF